MVKDEILSRLASSPDVIITGGALARQLGVSRTAIWKAVHSLREEGYAIEALPNSGYRFSGENDALSCAQIRQNLSTAYVGKHIEILKTVDSSNLYLKRQNARQLPDGYVVIADEQTGGLGRRGRSFLSPGGQGLYMSLLLKPDIPPEEIQFLTICTAVGVCRAIEQVYGLRPGVKWVNDIFYEGKKLCGILSEAVISAETRGVDSVIVGIGLNTGTIDPSLADIATSLYHITGKRGMRNRLAAAMLSHLEAVYDAFLRHGQKRRILDEYAQNLFILHQIVQVSHPQGTFEAEVLGLGEAGELIVRDRQGAVSHLQSGEVSLILKRDP